MSTLSYPYDVETSDLTPADRKAIAEQRRQARRDKLVEDFYTTLYAHSSSKMVDPKEALRIVLDQAQTAYQFDRLKRGWMEAYPNKVYLLQTDVEFIDSLPPRPPEEKVMTSIYDARLVDGPKVAR